MQIRLFLLILSYFLILSPLQSLKASDSEEELKGPQMGTRAPHSSLAPGTLEIAELQKKLEVLEKHRKKIEGPSKTGSSSSSLDKRKAPNSLVDSCQTSSRRQRPSESSHHEKASTSSRHEKPSESSSNHKPSKRDASKRTHKDASPHTHKIGNKSPENEAAVTSPKPRNTLDIATFMPSSKSMAANTTTSSSSSKVKKSNGRRDKQKQTSEPEVADTQTSSKEKTSPIDDLCSSLAIKMPQASKTLFAPKQLSPFYIMLALAAGTRKEEHVHAMTQEKESVTKNNKIYIPELDQIAGYKMMQVGTLDNLKTNLFYDDFSQLADVQTLLKLIRIKGEDSMDNIKMEVFMNKAKEIIKKINPIYLEKTKITTQYEEIDKREDNTLGGAKFKGNFGVYSFYEDGKLIDGLQVRLTFSKLK